MSTDKPTPNEFCQWCYDHGLRYSKAGPWPHAKDCPNNPDRPKPVIDWEAHWIECHWKLTKSIINQIESERQRDEYARLLAEVTRERDEAQSKLVLLDFFPLPGCLRRKRKFIGTDQRLVGDALAEDLSHRRDEAARIAALVFAFVEPENLLCDVAEQVAGLYAHVGAFDGPLEECPEVFKAVRVDIAAHVFLLTSDMLRSQEVDRRPESA